MSQPGHETEAWLAGPEPGVPPLLQPVAHMLRHAQADVRRALEGLTPTQLWLRPGGAAAVGFHVRHAAGSIDRLLTYARGEALRDEQRAALAAEADPGDHPPDGAALQALFDAAVEAAIAALRRVREEDLLLPRGVGRQQRPSTVLGILAHMGEHAARHAGQALTTAKILRGLALGLE